MSKLDQDFYYQLENIAHNFLPNLSLSLKLHHLSHYQDELALKYGYITINQAMTVLEQHVQQNKLTCHQQTMYQKRIGDLAYLCPDYLVEQTKILDLNQKIEVLSVQDILDNTRLQPNPQ